ncbi:hypothetical protein EYF80_015151 [Liparis tanakae]|uniref:Uncharacterized protein n=1 Tax=Liparis tanakae TaxID=230148 RepID=A0A4Z2IBA1_9TELE|nr:hypothetical protein EYF80_015151 [Liparis tanakae]
MADELQVCDRRQVSVPRIKTNRLRRREVRTLGRTDTKSERDNMVSVLWVNDGLSRPDARPETGGAGPGLASAKSRAPWRGAWRWAGAGYKWLRQV